MLKNIFGIIGVIIGVYIIVELAMFWYRVKHIAILPDIDQSDRMLGSGLPLRYIAAGDSTAVGEGASDADHSYTVGIAKSLSVTRQVTYQNIAVRGAWTDDVINNQLSQIIAFNPDIITISISANDMTHMKSGEGLLNNYKKIISVLTDSTHAQIYITTVPNFNGVTLLPWLYVRLIEYRAISINKKIIALGSDRVHIVNIHDFGWSQFPDRSITYAADGFHPNDVAYKNWTGAFLDSMKAQ